MLYIQWVAQLVDYWPRNSVVMDLNLVRGSSVPFLLPALNTCCFAPCEKSLYVPKIVECWEVQLSL